VLAALAVHANGLVSSDRLIAALWGETPPPSAAHTLQTIVSRLRRELGADRIEARLPGYVLRVESTELDALCFEELVQIGLGAKDRPEEAATAFERALALWRGTPYAEFADEEFASVEVTRLTELHSCAVEEYAAMLVQTGRAGDALSMVEAKLAVEPFRERLRAVLMLALARTGRPVEALRAFDTYRRVLADEVGVLPSADLRALNDQILREHPDLGWRRPSDPFLDDPLPTGTVTFLFSDLVRSTQLWEEHPEAMKRALARHDALLRDAIEAHSGKVVKTTGDGVHAAFAIPRDAISAAVAAQQGLRAEPWGSPGELRVRMGIHTGAAESRDGDYYGAAVNRAARLAAAAAGGQVVVSLATAELVRDDLPAGVVLVDLGEHRLRDLARAERVFQLVHPGLTEDFPSLQSLDTTPGNLPLAVSTVIGRDDDIASVAELLDAERLVTLTGVGGVGKTRLALQVAASVGPSLPGGAWLCEFAAASNAETMEQVVAATLGVQLREGMSMGGAICEFLRNKVLLVVFDDCEHLIAPIGDLVQDILRTCPHVRLLATSRERLGIDGENVRPLRPLRVPEPSDHPSTALQSDAVRLFVERASAVNPSFASNESTVYAIGELCRRLDGVPLAIELAAARASAMSPAEMTVHLDERFRLLGGALRTGNERKRTLRATVDWSYSLLTPTEALVFDRLGTFPSTFDPAAAEAVAAGDGVDPWDVLDALTTLVDKSMLVADSTSPATRYSMLETLRAYARERLDENSDTDEYRRRHATHYARFAEEAGAKVHSAAEFVWRARLRDELDNLRAAVSWALDSQSSGDADLALRIIAALAYELPMDAATHVGVWATRALPRVHETDPGRRAAVVGAAAIQALFLGDIETAAELANGALREGIPPDCPAPMTVPTVLAMVETYGGRFTEAIRMLRDPIPSLEAADDRFGLSSMYSTLAVVERFAGHDAAARTDAEHAVDLGRRINSPHALSLALFSLGGAVERTDPATALASYEECIALVQAGAGGRVVLVGALDGLAQLRAAAHDPVGALEALRMALAHAVETGNLSSVSGSLQRALALLVDLDQAELAAALAGASAQGALATLGLLTEEEQRNERSAIDAARIRIGVNDYDRAFTRGAAMAPDDVVAYALRELDRVLAETVAT
jgi:predicted ATPase/class 3 adenylate cyclase